MIRKKVKVCSRCKQEKALNEFSKNKNSIDGHHCYCKICHKAWQKIYDDCHRRTRAQYFREYRRQKRGSVSRKPKIEHSENYKKQRQKIAAAKFYVLHKKKILEQNLKVHYERRIRLCQGNTKTQREALIHLRILLTQTEKALRKGDREALSLLKKKFEQLQTMVA